MRNDRKTKPSHLDRPKWFQHEPRNSLFVPNSCFCVCPSCADMVEYSPSLLIGFCLMVFCFFVSMSCLSSTNTTNKLDKWRHITVSKHRVPQFHEDRTFALLSEIGIESYLTSDWFLEGREREGKSRRVQIIK